MTSSFPPSLSVSAKSSENNLLPILSISASPSLPPNPNLTTSSLAPTNPDLSLPFSSSLPLTIISPHTPACAACKYQRRKCGPSCPLAPFFPARRNMEFMQVHRFFGVSNIIKALKAIHPADRQRAAESFIFEADTRAKDLAGGCLRIILEHHACFEMLNNELTMVRSQVAFYQAKAASAGNGIAMSSRPNKGHENEGYDQVGSAVSPVEGGNRNPEIQEERMFFDYFSYNGNNSNKDMSNTNNNNNNINNNNVINMNNNINDELTEIGINGSGPDRNVENHNEEKESNIKDPFKPFIDIFGLGDGNEKEEKEIVQNNNDDATDCDRELDMPMRCNLGL